MEDTANAIEMRFLQTADARQLASLISDYVQFVRRGAAPEPDLFYTENLLAKGGPAFLGAFKAEALVGFCMFQAVPDLVDGLASGQINHIFVREDVRGTGIGEAMIDHVIEEAYRQNWNELVLVVPRSNGWMRILAEKMAAPAETARFAITLDMN